MAVITMREALNQALREELQRDENVFLMGEEVAEYQGAYKVTKGLLDEFGDKLLLPFSFFVEAGREHDDPTCAHYVIDRAQQCGRIVVAQILHEQRHGFRALTTAQVACR